LSIADVPKVPEEEARFFAMGQHGGLLLEHHLLRAPPLFAPNNAAL